MKPIKSPGSVEGEFGAKKTVKLEVKDTPTETSVNNGSPPPPWHQGLHFPPNPDSMKSELEECERNYKRLCAIRRRERELWLQMQPNRIEALGVLLKAKDDNSDLPGIDELRRREWRRRFEERRQKQWLENLPFQERVSVARRLCIKEFERREQLMRKYSH